MTEQQQQQKPFALPFPVKGREDEDPFLTFKFWVEVDEGVIGGFKECSGLHMERTVETVEEGGVNDHVHVLPGRNKYSNITLKRGVMADVALWSWFNEGLFDCKVTPRAVTIVVSDRGGRLQRRWNLTGAFPVKWEGPGLNVEQSQVAIETLELAFATMTQTNVEVSAETAEQASTFAPPPTQQEAEAQQQESTGSSGAQN